MSKPTNKELISELRRVMANNTLHWTTFLPVPQDSKPELEKVLKDSFRIWADSWVYPLIDDIEARLVKNSKAKK